MVPFHRLPLKNAEVSGTALLVMGFLRRFQAAAQRVRRERLAAAADVVVFAFDGQECGAPDRSRIDSSAPPAERAGR
jgi:hypothetical protein